MAARDFPAAYRLHAAHCIEIAAHTTNTENKLTLLNMARAWLRLAEQSEKNIYETSGADQLVSYRTQQGRRTKSKADEKPPRRW